MADAHEPLHAADLNSAGTHVETPDPPARQRLLVITPPASRSKERPVTSLANVFGRFAEMQQQVGDQVVALEDLVSQQGQQISDVGEQLPDMKERINWLIASYYENDCKDAALRERMAKQEAGLAKLTDAVRGLCEAQTQWKQTMDQLLQILGKAVVPVVPPPTWE